MHYKNDILARKQIINEGYILHTGDEFYLTANPNIPQEHIYIPEDRMSMANIDMAIARIALKIPILDENDHIQYKDCHLYFNGSIRFIEEEDLTWVGNEDNGCWAYYN